MQGSQRDIEEKSSNTQAKSESLQDMKKIRDNGEVDTEKKNSHDGVEANSFNNIIYYNENIEDLTNIYEDSDYFEKNTSGAFILCTNIESLKLIREEIIEQNKKNPNILFNLILGEFDSRGFQEFLNEKKQFAKYIQNTVIFNKNKKDVNIEPLTIYETCDNKEAIKNLIISFSSKNIKPLIINKLIKYQDYLDKYKIFHKQISNFYGDLSSETFIKYYEKLKVILEEEEKQKNLSGDINTILEKYSCFKIENNSEINNKRI